MGNPLTMIVIGNLKETPMLNEITYCNFEVWFYGSLYNINSKLVFYKKNLLSPQDWLDDGNARNDE